MPGDLLSHFTRTRILNKPLNMQLLGDVRPAPRRESGNNGTTAGRQRSYRGAPGRDNPSAVTTASRRRFEDTYKN